MVDAKSNAKKGKKTKMDAAKDRAKKAKKTKVDDKDSDYTPETQMVVAECSDKTAHTKVAAAKSTAKKADGTMVSCRPVRLVSLIGKLTEAQVAAVKKIGFGGVLELKISNFPLSYVRLFLDAFSDESYVFRASRKKEFMITKHDVHDCFLIPFGPNPLPLVPTGPLKGSNSPENKALKDKWRNAYGVQKTSSSICIGKVFTEIEAHKQADDHLCRLFVLLCMSSFLAPTLNNGIDLKLLRAVEDVSAISEFDWCNYVLQNCVKAGADFKKSPTMLGGCIPFLMITYCQRYDYKGSICAHSLPLIQHWDEKELVSRLKWEVSKGGLGRLTFSRVKYPRCLQVPSNMLSLGSTSGEPRLLLTAPPRSTSEKKFIQIELPPGVEDDQELKARSVDGIHELYLQLQRNAVVFYSWYADATAQIKCATTDPAGPSPSQSSQQFFEDQKVQQFVSKVEDLAETLKNSVANAPKFQNKFDESPKKDDGVDVSMRQVSDVLRDLRNDGQLASDDSPQRKDKADGLTKAVAVSWSKIMEDVVGHARAEEDATVQEPVVDNSFVIEGQVHSLTVQTERELLLEAMYSEEDINIAFSRAHAAGTGAVEGGEVPDSGPSPGKKDADKGELEVDEPANEKEESVVEASPLTTLDYLGCVYSTVEFNEVVCGQPEAGAGPVDGKAAHKVGLETDQQSANLNEDVVAEIGEKVTSVAQSTEWRVSQIPMTFCTTAELNEAFTGVSEAVCGVEK